MTTEAHNLLSMAEVQRPDRMSSYERSYRGTKCAVNIVIVPPARVCYTGNRFNVLVFATRILFGIEMASYLSSSIREDGYPEPPEGWLV